MFAIKEQLKVALLVVVSLSTIGLVGNFYPLSVENADAHPHTVIQSTVTSTYTALYSYKYLGSGYEYGICPGYNLGPFEYRCTCPVDFDKYRERDKDYQVTWCYLDDGHDVYIEHCGGPTWVDGTEKDGDIVYFYDWSTHEHGYCGPI